MMRAEIKIRQSGATSRSYNISHDELRKADFDHFKKMAKGSAKFRDRLLRASGRADLIPPRPERRRNPHRTPVRIGRPPKPVPAPPIARAPCPITDPQTWRQVIAAVAWDFDVEPDDMVGKCRKRALVDARHTAMFILVQRGRSRCQVGSWFGGRDHSTVINALDRFMVDASRPTTRATATMIAVARRYAGVGCSI